jgi:aryl-alcohol dehydrogenase-like predicted oxidoreductase
LFDEVNSDQAIAANMNPHEAESLRPIGQTDILVTPVALGCWPIAGVSSVDVNEADSLRTIEAALAAGVNFLDTAYMYGYGGESERLIGRAVAGRRDDVVIATKCGLHWNAERQHVADNRPEVLKSECEQSLRRLGTDHVELLYLHAPDNETPIADAAGALKELIEAGKTRCVGVSNLSVEQMGQFHAVCPVSAVQPAYNMLQRQAEQDVIPWCMERDVSVVVYWPLLKGLLAGRLPRDHVFAPKDGRPKYPMFQGEEWQKNQDFVDQLRLVAENANRTVAQIVINWTIHRSGITCALCGAKRPYQIEETAGAMGWRLSSEQLARIDRALQERGTPVAKPPV